MYVCMWNSADWKLMKKIENQDKVIAALEKEVRDMCVCVCMYACGV